MRMSPHDWEEFISKHKPHVKLLLLDLQNFVHITYIHEESTHRWEKWGQLCTIAEYPLCHTPYEKDR